MNRGRPPVSESTSSLAAGQKPPKDLVVRHTSLWTDLGVCATRVAANQTKRFNPGMKNSTLLRKCSTMKKTNVSFWSELRFFIFFKAKYSIQNNPMKGLLS